MRNLVFRRARPDEAPEVAFVARRSRRQFLPYLPDLHTLEGDIGFYQNRVFADCAVWVADDDGQIVGFCAFKPGWLEHLYLLPSHVGQSIGSSLLAIAKERQPMLHLWVFQQNVRAIRFYARHGFHKIRETDGATNEEQVPDALYRWSRGPDRVVSK